MRFISEIKFAFLAVLCLAGWTLLAWQLGWHANTFEHAQYARKFGPAVFAVCIWLAIRERRERRQAGSIEFEEGFQSGMIVSALAAFANGAFIAFYSRVLNPGWLQRAWEWQKAGLLAGGAKEAEVGRHEAIATTSQMLVSQLLFEPIRTIIMGMIITTAIAAVMRRKQAQRGQAASVQ